MSAIFAFVGPLADVTHDVEIDDLLASMSHRGSEEAAIWRASGALLAVVRDRWEMTPGFAGPTMVASRGPFHVVCDATLYYEADLKARLSGAGITAEGDSAADLIAGAYAAFGEKCVDYLEGDFAFCVWDDRAQALFCARDPFGTRSLFHLELDGNLFVASTAHPLVKRQGARAAFDATSVLRSLLLRHGDGTTIAWKGVREIPSGHFLSATPHGLRTTQYWTAQGSRRWAGLSSEDAVRAFSHLLTDASRERGHPHSSSLAMSGGMDSTAILASLDPNGPAANRGPMHIVSFKFPEGDLGNEDWYVDLVAGSFALPVHWVNTSDISFFDGAQSRALLRSDCYGHLFEGINRAIAGATRRLGSRILLNGNGGDNLCAVGDATMAADLVRRGRYLELRRFLAERGYRGRRRFFNRSVRPALPLWALDAIEPFLGRHICSRPYERPVPPWVVAEGSRVARITKADRQAFSRSILRHHSTVTARQRAYGLMYSHFQRTCGLLFDLVRDEGVELRMPFYDARLVEFVMSRPAEDFNRPGEYKVLLQRAMEGRLPDRTREPTPSGFKTGTMGGLLDSRWGPDVLALTERLSDRPWISEELGVVDRQRFVSALATGDALHWRSATDVCWTLLAEVWLRAHGSGATPDT